jgi:hypothetical protein
VNSKALATKRVTKHMASIICTHCGGDAVEGLKGGYLVRVGDIYRHAQPIACAYIIERQRRITAAKQPWAKRLIAAIHERLS